jgi:hypothetical protein
MGPLNLHGLAPGQVRSLTPREVRELKELPKKRKPEAREEAAAHETAPPRRAGARTAPLPDDADWES